MFLYLDYLFYLIIISNFYIHCEILAYFLCETFFKRFLSTASLCWENLFVIATYEVFFSVFYSVFLKVFFFSFFYAVLTSAHKQVWLHMIIEKNIADESTFFNHTFHENQFTFGISLYVFAIIVKSNQALYVAITVTKVRKFQIALLEFCVKNWSK